VFQLSLPRLAAHQIFRHRKDISLRATPVKYAREMNGLRIDAILVEWCFFENMPRLTRLVLNGADFFKEN
jgi:hypothetical protein